MRRNTTANWLSPRTRRPWPRCPTSSRHSCQTARNSTGLVSYFEFFVQDFLLTVFKEEFFSCASFQVLKVLLFNRRFVLQPNRGRLTDLEVGGWLEGRVWHHWALGAEVESEKKHGEVSCQSRSRFRRHFDRLKNHSLESKSLAVALWWHRLLTCSCL